MNKFCGLWHMTGEFNLAMSAVCDVYQYEIWLCLASIVIAYYFVPPSSPHTYLSDCGIDHIGQWKNHIKMADN